MKNEAIFEKSQRKSSKDDDWYSKLQQSKEAFLRIDNNPMPSVDYSGAFDELLKSKKEMAQQNSGFKKPFDKYKLSKEQEIQIGLDMIPMFQAKEEELTHQHNKLKGLRQEIQGYMNDQGIKVKYV